MAADLTKCYYGPGDSPITGNHKHAGTLSTVSWASNFGYGDAGTETEIALCPECLAYFKDRCGDPDRPSKRATLGNWTRNIKDIRIGGVLYEEQSPLRLTAEGVREIAESRMTWSNNHEVSITNDAGIKPAARALQRRKEQRHGSDLR